MPKTSQSEQFDRIVAALLASPAAVPPNSGKQLAGVAAGQRRSIAVEISLICKGNPFIPT